MFVTDTVDSVYRPDDWFPESLLDQLAEIIGDLPAQKVRYLLLANWDTKLTHECIQSDGSPSQPPASSFALHHDIEETPTGDVPLSRNLRQPLLHNIKDIRSIRELEPFFSSVSIQAFEGVYASIGIANVDWAAVESGLLSELFEST